MSMGIMDLSINQEAMGVQTRLENHVFKLNEYDETDVKGNNNLYNSRKTDTNDDPGSLFEEGYSSENLQVDPSLFSYSSFKKAMDLRTHNRTDENTRTIFDDADYFAKNFFYKLLPITFEQVDETVIQSEHNYSLCSLDSESETEEDCSRTMDYSQIKEKNYKRRRTKFKDGSDNEDEEWDENKQVVDSNQNIPNQKQFPEPESQPEIGLQPLDLSAAPPVQEQKTDHQCHLKEHSPVVEEKLPAKLNCIQVTITRPDEKENYQPCDMFLNDIARLVPRLINNDCLEIDILDKTGDRHEDLHTHRLYYIIAESTWRLFQSTSERVILTNDQTLGPPVKKIEKEERPTFLVFDQFSLAKCLAEYCQEIGGCFEYTCVEEGKEIEREEDDKNTKLIEIKPLTEDETQTEIHTEETETVEATKSDTENGRTDETNAKSEERLPEEMVPKLNCSKMDGEDEDSDTGKVVPKIELNEEEVRNGFAETETENFNESTKVEAEATEETVAADLEKNETNPEEKHESAIETKETKMDANMPADLESNQTKPRKRIIKKKKRARKIKINAKDLNTNKIEKINEYEVEEEKRSQDLSEEKTVIPINTVCTETDKIDAKETKEIGAKTAEDEKLSESTEKAMDMVVDNEETIEKDLKIKEKNEAETKENEIQEKTIEKENVRKTDEKESKAENTEKTVDERSKKSISESKRKRTNKRGKKRSNVREIHEDETKRITETKSNQEKKANIDAKEMKSKKIETKRTEEAEAKVKVKKIVKKIGKPIKQEKNPEKVLEVGKKRKREEVEKTKKPPCKKIRRNIKPQKKPFVAVPQIKTRSKSTSESETSQKPNKEVKKSKNTEKKFGKKVKETAEKKTRSGKMIEEKKEETKVKENGLRVRGRKRKLVEEKVVEKRQLRSQGEKINVEKMSVFNKRRKR